MRKFGAALCSAAPARPNGITEMMPLAVPLKRPLAVDGNGAVVEKLQA